MHSANDVGAVDTLANFELAVNAARNELSREQKRYEALKVDVQASESKAKELKLSLIDAADRCEVLENECTRLSHANDQRRSQISHQRTQLEALAAPRAAIEAETASTQKAVSLVRKELCDEVMKSTAAILASIRDHNPDDLKTKIEAMNIEINAAQNRVEKYKLDLTRYLKEKAEREQGFAATADDAESDNAIVSETDRATKEDRTTLSIEIARLERELSEKKAQNQKDITRLTQQRDELRPMLRTYGHSMPLAEQKAQEAEQRYNELLDQTQGICCCKCGNELGFAPLSPA